MSLIERLKSRRRQIHRVEVPGWDEPVGLVRLTQQEEHDAHVGARETFTGEVDLVLSDAFMAEVGVQILARAMVYPDHLSDGQIVRVFKSPKELRELCDGAEIEHLLTAYNAHPAHDLWREVGKAGGVDGLARAVLDPPTAGTGERGN